jgi:methionine synthase II (cobalamin-independent)
MKKSELRELVREQVRNLIKEANISQEAHTIHVITRCGQDAAQNFIDDNKLDGKKLAGYVRQHSNSKEKYDVRDIIAGTGVGANVSFKNRFLKQFQESVVTETFIGPFVFTTSTPDKELIAMYHGALDGFSNYKTGMKFSKADYKLAYQTIEKILQKKGVAITEADDPEAGEAAPYGSGYSEVNEAIDIHNDESAMKALEDIAVNMTKWKGSEGAHYTDLLEKVIDFLKYGNHRTN